MYGVCIVYFLCIQAIALLNPKNMTMKEQGKNFFAAVGLAMTNPSFKKQVLDNPEGTAKDLELNAEEFDALQKMVQSAALTAAEKDFKRIIDETTTVRGQRSGWMGDAMPQIETNR